MKNPITAEPFELQGNSNAALLFLHGFTGTPSEIYPAAQLINQSCDLTVSAIVLPGHGTTPEELAHTSWRDWTSAVEQELAQLRTKYQHLFVGGLSMGGLLSLYAASNHDDIEGVISINAPIFTRNPLTTSWFASALTPLLGLVKPYYPKQDGERELEKMGRYAYRSYPIKAFRNMMQVRKLALAGLCSIKCPVLVMQSLKDEVVNAGSGRYLANRLHRTMVSYQELENSGHVATMGGETDIIAFNVCQFIRENMETKGD